MQEYWINVYTNPFYGDKCYYGKKMPTLDLALSTAKYYSKYADVLYRIHVKLKPKLPNIKDGPGFNTTKMYGDNQLPSKPRPDKMVKYNWVGS